MKKLHTSFDYFETRALKKGDLFSYSPGTNAQEIMQRAKKLGGVLQYVTPNDTDYQYGNGGLTMRVAIPIPAPRLTESMESNGLISKPEPNGARKLCLQDKSRAIKCH
jgi:hypothetical protein